MRDAPKQENSYIPIHKNSEKEICKKTRDTEGLSVLLSRNDSNFAMDLLQYTIRTHLY